MRGTDVHQEGLFSYLSPESRIPKRHPLRPVREMVDIALSELSGQFESMYSDTGRRSIPPEKLLRALLLQILYSIRSERMLCEQLDYNLLFRWFIGLSMDDPVWDHSTFSKNRDRLLESDIARGLFDAILAQAEARDLTSDEHFTVDGTLIEALGIAEECAVQKMARMTRLKEVGVIRSGISTGKSARTIRMNRALILSPGCIAKVVARRPDSTIWVMC